MREVGEVLSVARQASIAAPEVSRRPRSPSLFSEIPPLQHWHRPPRRPRQRPADPWKIIARTAVALALAGAMALGMLRDPEGRPLVDVDLFARFLGFGIDQISVTGHRFTSDRDLFAALDLGRTRSLASFDAAAVRRRFEQLPWIKSAEITRVWPGELVIRVSERKAFAVWTHDGGTHLIDASGRVLSPVKRDAALDLVHVSGEGANEEAAAFLSQVARHPSILRRLHSAERVGSRRWTLHLRGGVEILLPPDGEVTALGEIERSPTLQRLIAGIGQIIDLRTAGQIAVRPASRGSGDAAALATSSSSRGG